MIDEEVKDRIHEIIEKYIYSILSIRQLATLYNLDYSTVYNIFHNSIYRGYIEYQNERYEIIDYIYINEELDEKIQTKLSLYKKQNKYIYLFKDKLTCSSCNSKLSCKSTKKKNESYLYYQCTSNKCSHFSKRINELVVIQLLYKDMNSILNKHMNTAIGLTNNDLEIENLINSGNENLRKLKKQQDKLLNLFLEAKITKDIYDEKNNKILKKINQETNLLSELHGKFNYTKYLKSTIIFQFMNDVIIDVKNHNVI